MGRWNLYQLIGCSCCSYARQPRWRYPPLEITTHVRRKYSSIQPPSSRSVARHGDRAADTVVLYRWPTMRHFRFISRLKVYQVSAMLLLLPPMTYLYLHGDITSKTMIYASVAAVGTTGVLFTLSYYFRRVVGEMAYVRPSNQLRLSTLTFIGGRRDLHFNVEDIIPFADSQLRMGGAVQRLEFKGHPEVYLYSLKYGRVLDFELLQKYLQF